MPAQIFFKFKSQLKFDSIPFDGLTISAKEVRRSIVSKKKMKIDESDLQLINAVSNEEYNSDDALIPENTSLIVVRLPRGSGSGPKVYNPVDKTTTKANSFSNSAQQAAAQKEIAIQSALSAQTKIGESLGSVSISKMSGSEEDKIATMQKQSASEYDSSKWVNMPSKPPDNYICHRCGLPGHFIKYCTYQGPPKVAASAVKKATGIPMAHTRPADHNTPGALITMSGDYVVPIIDSQAISEGKVEKPPFIESDSDNERNADDDKIKASEQSVVEIPKTYKCELCLGPLRAAVITPCCGESFCDECISDKLIKNERRCYVCGSPVNLNSLIPNKSLRDAVIKWQNDVGLSAAPKAGILASMKDFSPAGSPNYSASGNNSPHPGSRTPQKLLIASDVTSESSDVSALGKTKSSLASRLEIVEEDTSRNTDVKKSGSEAESSSTAVANTVASVFGNEMSKTLSDLYGAINWEDVAKSKNTAASNLPSVATQNSSLTKSSSSASALDVLAAALSPSRAIVSSNSSETQPSHQNNSSSTALDPESQDQLPNKVEQGPREKSVTPTADRQSEETQAEQASPPEKSSQKINIDEVFDTSKLSQSDTELLKALLMNAKKEADFKNSEAAAAVPAPKPAQQPLPFPPPHLMPSGAASLWGNGPLQFNPLLLPSMLPLPIPPVNTSTASDPSLLGVSFLKKPLSKEQFYARQKKLSKKSGDTNIKRLEVKLLEKQLQQLASSDESYRSDRKSRKAPRRRRSPSPRSGHRSSGLDKRGYREASGDRRRYRMERDEYAKKSGDYRRYEPYPSQSKRLKNRSRSRSRSRSASNSRSPRSLSPKQKGLKRQKRNRSPSIKELPDPIEEAVKSARQKADQMDDRTRPSKDSKKKRQEEKSGKMKKASRNEDSRSPSEGYSSDSHEELAKGHRVPKKTRRSPSPRSYKKTVREDEESSPRKSITPTMDEQPEDLEASPPIDFSLMAPAGMQFETEEERKMAEDILKQAHEKIMLHKRKALMVKQAEIKANGKDLSNKLEVKEEKRSIVEYAESPDPRNDASKADPDLMKNHKDSLEAPNEDVKESLVGYASEDETNEPYNDDGSKLTPKNEEGDNKMGEEKLTEDTEEQEFEDGSETINGAANETSKLPKRGSKVEQLRKALSKVDETVAREVNDSSVSSQEGTSQPSDYDHPQLSGEELIESPPKAVVDEDAAVKKKKKLRVEPPSLLNTTSSTADSDTEGAVKKQKKEKKSKSKKNKDRHSSPQEVSEYAKRDGKVKKKKKKKSKDDKEGKRDREFQQRSSSSELASKEPISSEAEAECAALSNQKREKNRIKSPVQSPIKTKKRERSFEERENSDDLPKSAKLESKNAEKERVEYRSREEERKGGPVSSAVISGPQRRKPNRRRSRSSEYEDDVDRRSRRKQESRSKRSSVSPPPIGVSTKRKVIAVAQVDDQDEENFMRKRGEGFVEDRDRRRQKKKRSSPQRRQASPAYSEISGSDSNVDYRYRSRSRSSSPHPQSHHTHAHRHDSKRRRRSSREHFREEDDKQYSRSSYRRRDIDDHYRHSKSSRSPYRTSSSYHHSKKEKRRK